MRHGSSGQRNKSERRDRGTMACVRGRGSRKAQTDGLGEDARGGLARRRWRPPAAMARGKKGTPPEARPREEVRGREDVRKRVEGKGAFLKLFLEKKRHGVIVSSSTNECTKFCHIGAHLSATFYPIHELCKLFLQTDKNYIQFSQNRWPHRCQLGIADFHLHYQRCLCKLH